MPFKYLRFSEQENKIINECLEANPNIKNRWLFSNLLVPSLLIILTIILTTIARLSQGAPTNSATECSSLCIIYRAISEVIFTGGITLIGISTLTIMAGYVIGTKKDKELENGIDDRHKPKKIILYSIREKLHDFSYPLLIIGSFVYVTQIIYKPSNFLFFILFVIIIVLLLKYSLKIALHMYITKDELFMKTYSKTMNDQVQDNVTGYMDMLDGEEEDDE